MRRYAVDVTYGKYLVVDRNTGETVATFTEYGKAQSHARRLNLREKR